MCKKAWIRRESERIWVDKRHYAEVAEKRVRSECNEGIKAVSRADDREGGPPHQAVFKGMVTAPLPRAYSTTEERHEF